MKKNNIFTYVLTTLCFFSLHTINASIEDKTTLRNLIISNQVYAVETLLNANLDLLKEDICHKQTPLNLAVLFGHVEMAIMMMSKWSRGSSNPTYKALEGAVISRAKYTAQQMQHPRLEEILNSMFTTESNACGMACPKKLLARIISEALEDCNSDRESIDFLGSAFKQSPTVRRWVNLETLKEHITDILEKRSPVRLLKLKEPSKEEISTLNTFSELQTSKKNIEKAPQATNITPEREPLFPRIEKKSPTHEEQIKKLIKIVVPTAAILGSLILLTRMARKAK